MSKYIFVTGGVVSSLGKGIISASIGKLLQARGYKITIEGLSERFNPEYWNYAKLISGILRYGMPIERVIALVSSLSLDSDNINSWTSGVATALKRYLPGYTSSPGDDE